ncbi:MAG: ORF6N domain-containing protein [Bacteriovorax sp.]|nr:ORF6N domain-containing protein [Bacteriovorax sp.]
MSNISLLKIESMIYVIREHKVMLDSDLAELYGVETKALKRAVKRNINRFPDDFMFEMNKEELENWRCQFGTSNKEKMGLRILPFAFTELGVAMLSSVLNSHQAIEVNISIMRIFFQLRSFLLMEEKLNKRMDKLESGINKVFKVVFQRLDETDDKLTPKLSQNRKKIGLNE